MIEENDREPAVEAPAPVPVDHAQVAIDLLTVVAKALLEHAHNKLAVDPDAVNGLLSARKTVLALAEQVDHAR